MGKAKPRYSSESEQSIQSLMVAGFKSIAAERIVEIRPLTILAGANSAGKSSALQPLLLLKQTLEAPYDPGPLLLNGPNVKFTAVSQFLPTSCSGEEPRRFVFGVGFRPDYWTRIHFQKTASGPIELREVATARRGQTNHFEPGVVPLTESPLREYVAKLFLGKGIGEVTVRHTRNRCFLEAVLQIKEPDSTMTNFPFPFGQELVEDAVTRVIHVPGLRGNPRRNYPLTAVGGRFPGTFEDYVASVIADAQQSGNSGFLQQLGEDLEELGLTGRVVARNLDDTQVELQVGRLPTRSLGDGDDLVSIADVGFGVSQTLPVVTALLAAKPGQLVYIEQPEIHLHPRAQVAMASLLARAAKRGVRVVIETHSSLLLLGVQQLVAEEELDPALVKLHWFQRDETGATQITSADLDAAGAFGDWPEDFDDVTLAAQKQYLDAAEKKLAHEPQEG